MTMTKGTAFFLAAVLAGGLVHATSSRPGSGASIAQLKTITSRTTGKGASLVIEATEPAAYVASSPDPLTVYVDLRNVDAEGVVNRFAAAANSPISNVAVEAVEALGAPVSRVRITLAQAVAHHVRSDRNTIVVEFEKAASNAPAGPPVSRRPASAIAALDRAVLRPEPQAAQAPAAAPPPQVGGGRT